MRRPGTHCTSRSTRVVFPVPDGADTMNSCPRVARASGTALLDILDLLPHTLELRLGVDDELGHVNAIGLRPDCVDLAIHLLQKEIQLATARLVGIGEDPPVSQMCAKSG